MPRSSGEVFCFVLSGKGVEELRHLAEGVLLGETFPDLCSDSGSPENVGRPLHDLANKWQRTRALLCLRTAFHQCPPLPSGSQKGKKPPHLARSRIQL